MLIKAKFDDTDCYINSRYVIDVIDIDEPYVKCYTVDENRPVYKVSQGEFRRWLRKENETDLR